MKFSLKNTYACLKPIVVVFSHNPQNDNKKKVTIKLVSTLI